MIGVDCTSATSMDLTFLVSVDSTNSLFNKERVNVDDGVGMDTLVFPQYIGDEARGVTLRISCEEYGGGKEG